MTNRRDMPVVDPVFYENMLERWREDAASVDESWRALFAELSELPFEPAGPETSRPTAGVRTADGLADATLCRAFRERGHLIAQSNPLQELRNGGLSDPGLAEFGIDPARALQSALAVQLHDAYCGTLSAEFTYMEDAAPREWLAWAMESGFGAPGEDQRERILDQLIAAECFEQFMQTKLPTSKRFGLEGSETQMPLCERLLECAASAGVGEIVLGPMHRGRTTFMALFMHKPLAAIFSEFQGVPWHSEDLDIAGDVTYHMGWSVDREISGRAVHISMASHPSHVESVIPVSLGKTRARQRAAGADGARGVLGLMMHTDAGFSGQGVVAECFQLSRLAGYSTGGSIHVVANNQVGFTTRPQDARSSRYCSDVGKVVQVPVLRVNGDDPEAAFRAATISCEFWNRFRRDIIIDLVCYRRQGHNELDEPRYTQPKMYAEIDRLPTVTKLYTDRLVDAGLVPAGRNAVLRAAHWKRYESDFEVAQAYKPNKPGRFERHWSGYRYCDLEAVSVQPETGVPLSTLKGLAAAQIRWPVSFVANPRLRKQLEDRADAAVRGNRVSWAAAEMLAFASLLAEGTPIRLTGEDTRRGTFSQRHAVVMDAQTEASFVPLNHLAEDQARFEVHDTPLSEAAVLAFEYGYSLADPATLVVWEAQFGDFANVAQTVIDQYIAPGEEKWLRSSGLVLLLPHGMEGGGPEHSSARLERFLQLCAKGNMHVVNCTTPANHFHALRRQVHRDFRKPLVVMAPKLLLRHRNAVSSLDDLGEGTRFRPVIPDDDGRDGAARVILCSGRVYHDLDGVRREQALRDVAMIRIEELYPFPAAALAETLKAHPGATVVWCQDEPENMGAWDYVERRIAGVLRDIGRVRVPVHCVARPANPSPAPGFRSIYERQQADLVERALTAEPR